MSPGTPKRLLEGQIKIRLWGDRLANYEIEYRQSTPLISSNHSINAGAKIAELRLRAACPVSFRCNFGIHFNVGYARVGVATAVNTGNIARGLKFVCRDRRQYHGAMIDCIRIIKFEWCRAGNIGGSVISLKDSYPYRIVQGRSGTKT